MNDVCRFLVMYIRRIALCFDDVRRVICDLSVLKLLMLYVVCVYFMI